MGDSLCGPSNALQNVQKHASTDRSLQQDRLTSARPGPAQGFRSRGQNGAAVDQEFAAFESSFSGPALPEVPAHLQQPQASFFPPGSGHARPQTPSRMAHPGPQIGMAEWTSEFQRLQISEHRSSPAPQAQLQGGPQGLPEDLVWEHEFRRQQAFHDAATWQNEHRRRQAFHQAVQSENEFNRLQVLRQDQEWENEFKRRQAELDRQTRASRATHSAPTNPPMGGMAMHEQTEPPVRQEATERPQASNAMEEPTFDEAAFEAAFADAQEEMMRQDIEAEIERQDGRSMWAFQQETPRIGADLISGEPDPNYTEADELARAAENLLNAVSHDESEKFKQSNFFALMRQFRDREAVVEGGEIRQISQPLHPGGQYYPEQNKRPFDSEPRKSDIRILPSDDANEMYATQGADAVIGNHGKSYGAAGSGDDKIGSRISSGHIFGDNNALYEGYALDAFVLDRRSFHPLNCDFRKPLGPIPFEEVTSSGLCPASHPALLTIVDNEPYTGPPPPPSPPRSPASAPSSSAGSASPCPPPFSSLYTLSDGDPNAYKPSITECSAPSLPAFAPAPPFEERPTSTVVPAAPSVVADTKAAFPGENKGEPSGKGSDDEPPPPYTEGSSPLESFTYVMAAAGGAASIITQVQQSGGPPLNTLGDVGGDEHITLDLRGTHFTLSRDELLTLPEFVLLSLFPNGLLPDGQMSTFHEGDVYPVDYDPISLQYMLDFFRSVAQSIPSTSPSPTTSPEGELASDPLQQGSPRDMLQDRAGIIVLREDLDFYVIPPKPDIDHAGMTEIKRAAGRALLKQDGIFSGLRKSDEPGTTEQHLIEMLTAGGFNHDDRWGHRAGEPNKAVICSLALAKLRTDIKGDLAGNNAVGMAQKLLLFWRKPARRCWWEGVELRDVEGIEVEAPLKVWIRRVWTLEMSVIGLR